MEKYDDFATILRPVDFFPLLKNPIITRPLQGDVPDGGSRHSSLSASSVADSEPLDLRREDHRLKTLAAWPAKFMDAAKAARSGFYYFSDADKVRCFFCKIELHQWREGDDIVTDHGRWSPNCPLLSGAPCGNVPLSRDECGVREGRGPAHAGFLTHQSRLATFANWPSQMKQTPESLADAGFYYTGIEDQTLCYQCGGGLKDWEDDDVPWEQHAIWFSRCPYVLTIKGEEYVKSLRETSGSGESTSTANFDSCSENNHSEVKTSILNSKTPQMSAAVSSDRSTAVTEEESKMCKICFADERTVCFVPCGHVVACAKCAMSVLNCPICRKPFTSTMRLYYS